MNMEMAKAKTSTAGNKPNKPHGFTYILLLATVVILGITMQSLAIVTSTQQQREKENELIFRGLAYKQAIISYKTSGPQKGVLPRNLEDLLLDRRFPSAKHHIRSLYPDPFSHTGEWRVLRLESGEIYGVASKGEGRPKKRKGFPEGLEEFENATSYADWVFAAKP